MVHQVCSLTICIKLDDRGEQRRNLCSYSEEVRDSIEQRTGQLPGLTFACHKYGKVSTIRATETSRRKAGETGNLYAEQAQIGRQDLLDPL